MVDQFFQNDSKKRKRTQRRTTNTIKRNGKRKNQVEDEEISGSDSDIAVEDISMGEDNGMDGDEIDSESESEMEFETAEDVRRRKAKNYLDSLSKNELEDGFDAADLDRDNIARRLKDDTAESKGKVYRFLADHLLIDESIAKVKKLGESSITCIDAKFPYIYTTSKDLTLAKWDFTNFDKENITPRRVKFTKGKRLNKKQQIQKFQDYKAEFKEHIDDILTVSISPDGKYVVTGGKDKHVLIWNTESLSLAKAISTRNRQGTVLSIAFRKGTDQFFAACADLTVRVYSVGQMSMMETLFGHENDIVDISSLHQERCVTVGSRDRRAFHWKIPEEKKLIYSVNDALKKTDDKDLPFHKEGSIDCVSMIDEQLFVTGSDNGNIRLWSIHKSKPVFTYRLAHGLEQKLDPSNASAEAGNVKSPEPTPYWITSIYAIPYSDIFFSGSFNGEIKAWKLDQEGKLPKFQPLGTIKNVRGFINKITVMEKVNPDKKLDQDKHTGFCLVAAVSKEPRLGRWKKVKGGKNGIVTCVIQTQFL